MASKKRAAKRIPTAKKSSTGASRPLKRAAKKSRSKKAAVEYEDVVAARESEVEAPLTVDSDVDLVTFIGQQLAEQLHQLGVVLDQQHPRRPHVGTHAAHCDRTSGARVIIKRRRALFPGSVQELRSSPARTSTGYFYIVVESYVTQPSG